MIRALHIARRDLRASFQAPLAWLLLTAWLFLVHAVFALTLLRVHGTAGTGSPLFVEALWWGTLFLALLAPAVTMNAWAAERGQGTWQLLMTLPVRPRDLVLGKFLAALGMLAALLVGTLAMPITLAVISEVAASHLAAAYLGLGLLILFLAALGTWIGLVVESPVAAYVLTFAAIALCWLIGLPQDDGVRGSLAAACGLGPRLTGFLAGQVRLGDVAWFVGGSAIFLTLAHGAIQAPRTAAPLRWWRRIGAIGAPVVGIAALVVALVAAGDRSRLAADWSADRRFTLDPALVRILAQPEPITLTGIWADNDDPWATAIADVGVRMAAAGARVRWQRWEPLRHKPQLADLASRIGGLSPPCLVVERDGRTQVLPLHPGSRRTLQRDTATALAVLADPDPVRAWFTQGHGELRLAGGADDGIDQTLTALAGAGFRPQPADDAATAPPPRDLILVAGPTAPLGPAGLARLDEHLRDGGGLCIAADDRAPDDLVRWLGRRGVVLPAAIPVSGAVPDLLDDAAPRRAATHLVSLNRHVAGQESELPHHNLLLYGDGNLLRHPATEPLLDGGLQLLSPFTAPLALVPREAPGFPERLAGVVLTTVPGDSWERRRGEPLTIPDGLAQADPRALAVVCEFAPDAQAAASGRGGRMLVWGSRQALSDGVLARTAFANGTFTAQAAAWLVRREPPAPIPPAEVAAFQIHIGDTGLEWTLIVLCLVLPLACVGVAILTWVDSRK